MNTDTNIRKLEKIRLKLYKQMLEFEAEMETCSFRELTRMQFKFVRAYTKLLKVEKLILQKYPSITNEFDYIDNINYRKLK